MEKLYNWSAARSGNRITVTHSTGKVQVDKILRETGACVAIDHKDKRRFELAE